MSDEHWNKSFAKSLGIYLNGKGIHTQSRTGEDIIDDSFYVIFNAHHEALDFTLPGEKYGKQWKEILNTFENKPGEGDGYQAGDRLKAEGRSIILLQNTKA